MSATEATPPEAITGIVGRRQDLAQPVEVGAGAACRRGRWRSRSPRRPRPRPARRAARPPCGRCPAPSPGRPPRSDRRRRAGSRPPRPPGRDRSAASVRTSPGSSRATVPRTTRRTPPVEQLARRRPRPRTPPPVCDRDVDGGGDGQHRGPVDRPARPGGVEVDHVEPPGAAGHEAPGQRRPGPRTRSGGRSRPGSAGPPRRRGCRWPDRAPSPGARRRRRTKLARMPSPTAPDFSGWNWVPHTGPRSAEAVTGPPYSQVDEVSPVSSGA